jgi:AraC family transcriptional regulator
MGFRDMSSTRGSRCSEMMRAPNVQTLHAHELRDTDFSITRLTSAGPLKELTSPYEPEDAFMVTLQLSAFNYELYRAGQIRRTCAFKAGTVAIFDMQEVWQANMQTAFDGFHFHMPRSAMIDLCRRLEVPPVTAFAAQVSDAKPDVTLHHLVQALLPAIAHPENATRLFVDHIRLAIGAHLLSRYGEKSVPVKPKSKLAPWQENRAKELLLSRTMDNVSVRAVAAECGLSEAYFIRAFAQSTGQPPHRWLKHQRLAQAKVLLAKDDFTLSHIATMCGFFDQSHMTREFQRAYGTTPGQMRRRVQ